MSEHANHAIESLIDRHFAGHINPADERRMREVLLTCAHCRAYYDRHLILARLDPNALDAQTRLARGLGLGGVRSWLRVWMGVGALTVATAALVMVMPSLAGGLASLRSSAFGVRGTADSAVRLFVHRLTKQRVSERLGKKMVRTDELAFAYQNQASFSHLAVFAVDAVKNVYWYHPAWTDPTLRPSAIPIVPGSQTRELPEAISHRLPAGTLRIFGVFANRPFNVEEVEKAVFAAKVDASRLALPETAQVVEVVEVMP